MSNLENELMFQIKVHQLEMPILEYRFAAYSVGLGSGLRTRLKRAQLKDWRFDFAWPEFMFAVEVEGITPAGGRHQTIKGFNADLKKYHHAQRLGWTVYRTGRELIRDGQAIQIIKGIISNGQ